MDFKIFLHLLFSLGILIILSGPPMPKPVHLFYFQFYLLIQHLYFFKHHLQNAFR